MEKPLFGRFRLPRVSPGEKASNQELSPKSGDITCMVKDFGAKLYKHR